MSIGPLVRRRPRRALRPTPPRTAAAPHAGPAAPRPPPPSHPAARCPPDAASDRGCCGFAPRCIRTLRAAGRGRRRGGGPPCCAASGRAGPAPAAAALGPPPPPPPSAVRSQPPRRTGPPGGPVAPPPTPPVWPLRRRPRRPSRPATGRARAFIFSLEDAVCEDSYRRILYRENKRVWAKSSCAGIAGAECWTTDNATDATHV